MITATLSSKEKTLITDSKDMKQRGYSGSRHQASFKEKLVIVQVFMHVFQNNSKRIFYNQVPCFKTPFYLDEHNPKNLVLYNCRFKICVYFLSLSTSYNVETPKKQQTVPTFHPVSV